ncbi:MAG: hypothetical protein L6R36_009275 [Xanthoria steineri]|nr:MAG: hypothetical protein L6R36_009275 [Xanthoria steineri]
MDIAALGTFFMGVAVCFTLSTIIHTCANHSEDVWIFTNQLDYLGIVIVIWGSSVSSDFFGFYCDEKLQLLYWTVATASAVGCGIFTLTSNFRSPAYRLVRFGAYSLLGLSAFVPVIHGIIMNGWQVQDERMSISYFLGLAVLNFTGASIYAARIPERWYPRTFDLWGSSHQIMHVLVVCGAFSHTTGLMKAFDFWHARRGIESDLCAKQ